MSFFSNDGYGRGGFLSNTPVAVRNIIIVNIVIFIATLFKEAMMVEKFALWFPLSPFFEWWQPVTHLFMHGGFFHLFFNMYTLYIFGSVLERVWGPKKFLMFYFITGLGAAAVHMGVQWYEYSSELKALGLSAEDAYFNASIIADYLKEGATRVPILNYPDVLLIPTVGASGAIYGVLMGYAMLYPNSLMRLIFPPVTLKAKWFVLIFAGLELLLGMSLPGSSIAHFAHLGGLIFGFLLILYWKKTRQLYGNY